MTEEKEEQNCQVSGVLIGLLRGTCGCVSIGMDINGAKAVLDIERAVLLLDQLGMLLESLGALESDDVPVPGEEKPCTRH